MRFQRIIPTHLFGPWILGLAGAAGAVSMPAQAAALAPPSSLVGCAATTATPAFIQDPTSCILGSVEQASASATLPFIKVTASAFSPAGAHTAQANAGATYHFQVTGGTPGDIVPILIATTMTTSATEAQSPRGYASATLAVFTTFLGHTVAGPQVCTYVAICQSFVTSFSGTRSYQAESGSVGDFVNLTVQASASGANGLFDESASAFADPYIFVDPSFANASLYSVVVSPGVDNTPTEAAPAPEPATAALFALGLLCCAAARRRKI